MQISFIIPAYNVEKYIETTLDSIVEIGLDDFEIIVVNDCSTDDTVKVVTEYSKADIILLHTNFSKGFAGQPRNIGINVAIKEYICFIDPDDRYIAENMKLINNNKFNSDIIINSYSRAKYIEDGFDIIEDHKLRNKSIKPFDDYTKKIKGICLQRMIFRRSFLVKNNILFDEDIPMQDALFLFSAFNAEPKIHTTSVFTTIYFINRENSITNQASIESIINKTKAVIKIVDYIETMPYNKRVKKKLINNFIKWHKNNIENVNSADIDKLLENDILKVRK